MTTVTYRLEDLKNATIELGFVGENEHRMIRFDSTKLFDEYPDAIVALTVVAPSGEAYPAVTERDGNFVSWVVTDSDLASDGSGELQLTFIEGSAVAKTYRARTKVYKSIEPTGEAPSPVETWLDEAQKALATFPRGGSTGQVLTKKSGTDFDAEWKDPQGGGGGTSNYNDLENKPSIGGTVLSGDVSLEDLGAAREEDIPDVSGKADKIANPTSGNLVAMDANGNIQDSGEPADAIPSLREAIAPLSETKTTTKTGVDLDLADSDGNVLLRLANGHIMTKNFDSSEVREDMRFGVVEENRFASDLTGWTYTNCTASDGLNLTTESKAYRASKKYTNDTWYLRGVFEINTLSSVFGLVMEWNNNGAIFLVDGGQGTINLYREYKGSFTLPTLLESEEIGFTIATGKRYILEVFKVGFTYNFTITDELTGESTTVSYDNAVQSVEETFCGSGHGGPGVICVSGDVDCYNLIYSVRNFPHARALFIGDSIEEGVQLHDDSSKRWCALTAKYLFNNDAFIMGCGGDASSGVNSRLTYAFASGFKADYVIVKIGTNERNDEGTITDWATNIGTIVNTIETNGAIPVICCPPLASTKNATILNMRDFILGKGYQTIRFDIATSTGDGSTYDSSAFTDGLHPNATGHYRMFQRAMADIHAL